VGLLASLPWWSRWMRASPWSLRPEQLRWLRVARLMTIWFALTPMLLRTPFSGLIDQLAIGLPFVVVLAASALVEAARELARSPWAARGGRAVPVALGAALGLVVVLSTSEVLRVAPSYEAYY